MQALASCTVALPPAHITLFASQVQLVQARSSVPSSNASTSVLVNPAGQVAIGSVITTHVLALAKSPPFLGIHAPPFAQPLPALAPAGHTNSCRSQVFTFWSVLSVAVQVPLVASFGASMILHEENSL
jgi:hypothetical protein